MPRTSPRWRFVVPVVAVGAGLLFGISASISRGVDLRPNDTGDLAGVIQRQNTRVYEQQRQVRGLQDEVQRLSRGSGNAAATRDTRAGDAIAPSAGLAPVRGDGLKVTLTDSTRDVSSLPQGGSADWLVVHQQDVQGVVNALWRGGASAMMLMDQRVIATSAVRCVGNTLILQGRVYSPPFTITAIGDPAKLRDALQKDPQVANYRAYVDIAGLGYDVAQVTTDMPAYSGSLTLRHAKPVA